MIMFILFMYDAYPCLLFLYLHNVLCYIYIVSLYYYYSSLYYYYSYYYSYYIYTPILSYSPYDQDPLHTAREDKALITEEMQTLLTDNNVHVKPREVDHLMRTIAGGTVSGDSKDGDGRVFVSHLIGLITDRPVGTTTPGDSRASSQKHRSRPSSPKDDRSSSLDESPEASRMKLNSSFRRG